MSGSVQLPLSGAVSQSINPWEFWIRSMSSQMGLVNIRNVNSTDPALEQAIVEQVAGYGRQLGKISELLIMLVDRLSAEDLTPGQQTSVEEFREMMAQIERIKRKWRSPGDTLDAVEQMIAEIRGLRTTDPAAYEQALRRLQAGLDLDQPTPPG